MNGWSLVSTAGLLGIGLSGCSLIDPTARPEPNANHVHCILVYQPQACDGQPDLRFIAVSSPYRHENFNLSLPDGLLHAVFAPGRHLIEDAVIEGAQCEGRWNQGHRLPNRTSKDSNWLRCEREGLAAVLFSVKTQWGNCQATLSEGEQPAQKLDYWYRLFGTDEL